MGIALGISWEVLVQHGRPRASNVDRIIENTKGCFLGIMAGGCVTPARPGASAPKRVRPPSSPVSADCSASPNSSAVIFFLDPSSICGPQVQRREGSVQTPTNREGGTGVGDSGGESCP